jgi:hypothetical protein
MMLAEPLDFVGLRVMEKGHVSAASYFLYSFFGNLEHCYHRKKCIRDTKSADAPALHTLMAAHVFKSF